LFIGSFKWFDHVDEQGVNLHLYYYTMPLMVIHIIGGARAL
jgi:hypothetical protein